MNGGNFAVTAQNPAPKSLSPFEEELIKDTKISANELAINPDFDDSSFYSLDEITGSVEELLIKAKQPHNDKLAFAPNCNTDVSFPVHVFPEIVQNVINATCASLIFPKDFIGAAMLYTASVAIGNTYRVEIKRGYQQSAVLYMAIIGRPGTNKSQPLTFALQPLVDHDKKTYQEFLKLKIAYEATCNLSKKERTVAGYNEPIKPVWNKSLVSDITPEALIEVHKFNKRGIGLYVDELATWFKNFNRYTKGSEEEFWLSTWSGKPINVDRKTGEPTFIPVPFISVAGTLQPGILNELAKDNRKENGFIDRILMVMIENLQKSYWSEEELDPVHINNWNTVINNLLDLTVIEDEIHNPVPQILRLTPEAKALLFNWQKRITDNSNQEENDALSRIYSKMELYAGRLALILQLMFYAGKEDDKNAIGVKAVEGALELIEYFKNTALKVNSIISNYCPLDKLTTREQSVYAALPDEFKTAEGVKIAAEMEYPHRTLMRFLTKKELFAQPSRGEYKKLI